jgi:hypothetical protein
MPQFGSQPSQVQQPILFCQSFQKHFNGRQKPIFVRGSSKVKHSMSSNCIVPCWAQRQLSGWASFLSSSHFEVLANASSNWVIQNRHYNVDINNRIPFHSAQSHVAWSRDKSTRPDWHVCASNSERNVTPADFKP